MHFAVLVSGLQSAFMQLLSACDEREKVDAIFDLVPLDEALLRVRFVFCRVRFAFCRFGFSFIEY